MALEVALRAVGIGPGDEVIVSSFTFVVSATALLLCQGTPVFADIDPQTLNLTPAAAEAAIVPRTRAIVMCILEDIQQDGPVPSGIIFRTAEGRLKWDGLSTDGAILAARGDGVARSWFAADAHVVDEGSSVLFRSELPSDVVWQRDRQGVELSLRSASATDIEVARTTPPSAVVVDGAKVRFLFRAGKVVIRGLKKGEHRVSINE